MRLHERLKDPGMFLGNPSDSKAETFEEKKFVARLEDEGICIWSCLVAGQDSSVGRIARCPSYIHLCLSSTREDLRRNCRRSRSNRLIPRSELLVRRSTQISYRLVSSVTRCNPGIQLLQADDLKTWYFSIEVLGESLYKVRPPDV